MGEKKKERKGREGKEKRSFVSLQVGLLCIITRASILTLEDSCLEVLEDYMLHESVKCVVIVKLPLLFFSCCTFWLLLVFLFLLGAFC